MTTPIFPSVIGHNLLDGGTDAQDGNRYPGPLLQEYAAAVVGAAGIYPKYAARDGFRAIAPTVIDDVTGAITDYSVSTDWGNSSKTFDTTVGGNGYRGLKLQVSSTVGTFLTMDRVVSFSVASNETLHLCLYVPKTQLNGITVYITPDAGYTNNFSWLIGGGSIKPGYNWLSLRAADAITTGTISWGAMARFRIRWSAVSATYDQLVYCGLSKGGAARPQIVIGFDDGWSNIYANAYPVMRRYGLTGYVGVIGSLVGASSQFMTAAQMAELYAAGWEMVPHGATRLTLLGGTENAKADMARNKQFCLSNGWMRGNDWYIWPEGIYATDPSDFSLVTAAQELGFRAARDYKNTSPAQNRGEFTICGGVRNPYWISCNAIGGGNTANTLIGWINDAITQGRSIWLAGHKILATNNPTPGGGGTPPADGMEYYLDDFELVCQHIAKCVRQGLIDAPTPSAWLDRCL